ncbi:MAG TPA: class I SAM-dependent methyltransferase [Candidatus Saccharimonadales bacterium]|nr:class I SAM-dependent methyltransferase [Candidatus Saccharimonadales bacterium]
MRIVKGKKIEEMSDLEFNVLAKHFAKVVIDLGTGDGRFIFKSALANPNNLYVGIDPSQTQLEIYSQKALKNKLNNTLYVLGSIEKLPQELDDKAHQMHIFLPWGSLLQAIVKPDIVLLNQLLHLLKPFAELEIILGYNPETEPTETARLEIAKIDATYIEEKILPAFSSAGFEKALYKKLTRQDLKKFETTWSKKLTFGKDRPLYLFEFKKKHAD